MKWTLGEGSKLILEKEYINIKERKKMSWKLVICIIKNQEQMCQFKKRRERRSNDEKNLSEGQMERVC